jgi:phosphoserine aminotransferase
MQGGASLQFALVPMNLCNNRRPAYVNTGTWSTKAIKEAKIQGFDPVVIASSEDRDFTYIPMEFRVPENVAYLHITSNNTIKGTQWNTLPECSSPMVVDMSSDIFSKPIDISPCGLVYAGAQKNLGPAGVTLVVIRKDMLDRVPQDLPTMLRYTTYADNNSLYNTPPTFAIYVVGLVLKWLEEDMGGLEGIAVYNTKKANVLYDFMDQTGGFYKPTAEKSARSLMNVTFRLNDEALEADFVEEALKNGLCGLKGHKSVGGCRASLYNAVPYEAVEALVAFMADFMKRRG